MSTLTCVVILAYLLAHVPAALSHSRLRPPLAASEATSYVQAGGVTNVVPASQLTLNAPAAAAPLM